MDVDLSFYATINLKLVYEFLQTKEAIALLRQAVEKS